MNESKLKMNKKKIVHYYKVFLYYNNTKIFFFTCLLFQCQKHCHSVAFMFYCLDTVQMSNLKKVDPDSTSVTDKRGWLWRLLTKLLHACWSYIEGGKRGKKKKKNFLEKSFYVVRSTKKMGLRYRESYKSFPWDQYMNTVCKYYVWDGLKHAHRRQMWFIW